MSAIEVGKRYLITCDSWFTAPDGQTYCSAYGTVTDVLTTEAALGVKANARSANWFVQVGNILIAGCQIHYAFRTDSVDFTARPVYEDVHEGKRYAAEGSMSRIYDADRELLPSPAAPARRSAPRAAEVLRAAVTLVQSESWAEFWAVQSSAEAPDEWTRLAMAVHAMLEGGAGEGGPVGGGPRVPLARAAIAWADKKVRFKAADAAVEARQDAQSQYDWFEALHDIKAAEERLLGEVEKLLGVRREDVDDPEYFARAAARSETRDGEDAWADARLAALFDPPVKAKP